ncbi:hypothetical protein Tco_0693260, partial [Tanacetum coccineum]
VNKANQFTPRPVQLSNIRPNLNTASKTIKTGRVNVNTGHGKVNSGSVHVNSVTQIKSGASRFNTGKQHVNSGSVHVNSVTQIKSGSSRFNTGKQYVNSGSVHVNTVRVNRPVSNNTSPKLSQVNLQSPTKCFSKQRSPVNRPFSRNTAHKSNKYAVKGKMGTAVKTSAGCVWRKIIPIFNTNSGPTPDLNHNDHPLKHMEHRGIFDSGCSGHMTGNRAHLEDYQELSKVGSVTFGGSKGSISGKVGKGDARSTWTWKRTCQLSLANWMQIGYSIEYTITEESVRRQLQLADASGINMLQNEEIFAGLQNIGSKSGGWDPFG